ncbi:tRNA glutamyl-Q(34) synthetase GluQRS [Paracoccus sp. P2]|uniref:tRNA glutamyl-Q(34) synthetase GluQRS n=1 Tax=Paracoccus pantotrophus TaxID=82367 RepID=A0A7H9BRX5_PARPN|nr:tRNA glutamyl-Q(34) synthetase GluQRS [Paracoccus pantotrophus]MDF3854761.1 tRNA glutamyl-Q(34) synthetase GluQRS [Paracoccus pantotrophus]QLH13595.1 tRNA glutamyl-Q(34) synthetase GluQRS [Paracoccus pantotrophus]RDD96677.1 tRNA glutamyl-Q(34) synthetase GluQRS [Paracoccus pantotrophus]RNI17121.1 tRNA glutamyl-Q(34) synthetase GluQRS [Paracoccus pantotrophus]WGR67241.1 tRNA glutamyl-Q(34) synthetase GluQRS [Paracoccus pantotrophus]
MACRTILNRTRFAPSPTGPLHLGHAFAALTAARLADPGQFLLRIEDIDQGRCRPEYEALIAEDLHWLGLDWPRPVMHQSQRLPAYQAALERLSALGLTYPCRCRRADIRAALSAPQEGAAPRIGPDGPVYPGTCRQRRMADAGADDAIRLDAARALDQLGLDEIAFLDENVAPGRPHRLSAQDFIAGIGDVVLARRGMGTSYHLAVVVDDAAQDITLVTRGKDLLDSTWIHVVLQKLLELPTPRYHHHRLIRDEQGKRLAKRDDARALKLFRDEGVSAEQIRQSLGI